MKNDDFERRLTSLEGRVQKLEGVLEKPMTIPSPGISKQITLSELIKGKQFKSGQEKVAIIVGYNEKIVKKTPLKESDIREGWRIGKFDVKYDGKLLSRCLKAGWVRNIDDNLDLSQSGETFFDNFLKQKD